MSASARRSAERPTATGSDAPRLTIDFGIWTALLLALGWVARDALTPDGVAYLENAEALLSGQFARFLQGYWSPGYSLLTAPLALVAGADRQLLLAMVHVLQSALGVATLWVALLAVRAHIAAPLQRVAFAAVAWIVVYWLSPTYLTPDLPLALCLLGVVALATRDGGRPRFATGLLVGVGFLLKTSIWPWLVVALMCTALPAWRARSIRALPWDILRPAAAIVLLWLAALSAATGRPTLGSVGPLNARWYLGDLSRRTPDTDLGAHVRRREIEMPNGAVAYFTDLRSAPETYAPWSDPERWAAGVPESAAIGFRASQALETWRDNIVLIARWFGPLIIGLVLLAALRSRDAASGTVPWVGWPGALATGGAALVTFALIHAELRLLAPAGFLFLFGALGGREERGHSPRLVAVSWLLVAALGASAIQHVVLTDRAHRENAADDRTFQGYLETQHARATSPYVVIVGPAVPFMRDLWLSHLRVGIQFGAAGRSAVDAIPAELRLGGLRRIFGRETGGVIISDVTAGDGRAQTRWSFNAF